MKLSFDEVIHLWSWISGPLHGKEARARNVFVKGYKEAYKEILEGRLAILKGGADKDEKGEPIVENGAFKITDPEREKETQDAVKAFLKDGELEFAATTKQDKECLRNIYSVLSDKPMIGQGLNLAEGEAYDSIMTKFEEAMNFKG